MGEQQSLHVSPVNDSLRVGLSHWRHRIQVCEEIAARCVLALCCSPCPRQTQKPGSFEAASCLVQFLGFFYEQDALVGDLLKHDRRMGVDDHLPERIVIADGLMSVDRYVSQQLQNRGDSCGMNSVLRFFQTQNSLHGRIAFQNGQCQEPQRAVGECSCR